MTQRFHGHEPTREPTREPAHEPAHEPDPDKDLLRELFDRQKHSVDMLPHTKEEAQLYRSYNSRAGTSRKLSKREIYTALMNMRKASELPGKRRRRLREAT